jgi:hypothetical protein
MRCWNARHRCSTSMSMYLVYRQDCFMFVYFLCLSFYFPPTFASTLSRSGLFGHVGSCGAGIKGGEIWLGGHGGAYRF